MRVHDLLRTVSALQCSDGSAASKHQYLCSKLNDPSASDPCSMSQLRFSATRTRDLAFANNFSIQPACCSLGAAFSDAAARLHDGCPRSAIARAQFVSDLATCLDLRESRRQGARARGDGKIKRTSVRQLPPVAKGCLHIGFCNFPRRRNGTVQGVQVPPSDFPDEFQSS